jgi:hypothetical protein
MGSDGARAVWHVAHADGACFRHAARALRAVENEAPCAPQPRFLGQASDVPFNGN